jgi:Protein of unknown function (DUF1097)
MPALIALALSIGVLAVAATWLVLGPLAATVMQIWQLFIAWGCFFHSGGDVEAIKKTVICMSFGAVVGTLSVLLIGQLGMLGSLAAPVAVGIGAAVLVLAAHVGLLATIPASVYGFASIAGLILLKGVAPGKAILPTILSIVAGTVFGFASAKLGAAMTASAKSGAAVKAS